MVKTAALYKCYVSSSIYLLHLVFRLGMMKQNYLCTIQTVSLCYEVEQLNTHRNAILQLQQISLD